MPYDVIYVSMLMSERLCAEMTDRGVSCNVAAQTFHELLAEGIARNGGCGRLTALSGLHYSGDRIAFRKNEKCGNVDFVYAGHLNFPVLRTLSRVFFTFVKLLGLCLRKSRNTVLMVDPLLLFLLWPSVICSKLFNIPLFLVVTDLINFMDSSGGQRRRSWLKRQNTRLFTRLCGTADGYIVLTPQMCDIINPRRRPSLVMEGLIRRREKADGEENAAGTKRRSPRVVMYAGGIYKPYGVELLLKAFVRAELPDAELHLYGWGDMVPEVREICRQHPNIRFQGSVPHREIMAAEREATLLVNPRPGGQEFTKYSFPSKNLEYMASGTPLLAFMLPGIPEEYREYFFVIPSDDEAELAAQLRGIMGRSQDDLDAFGARAQKFAMDNKNNIAQAERVMSFVDDTIRAGKPEPDEPPPRKNRSGKWEYPILALIILLTIGLRLAHARYNLLTRDAIQYVLVAQTVRDDGFWTGFTAQYPPTMPPLLHLCLGTVVKAGGDPYRWGLLLMLAADAVFISALYFCGKKLFPLYRHAGLYAALFAATTPELIGIGNNILRDNLYLCFFALAVYCGLCMNDAAGIAVKPAVGYGLCCTAGMLCRKEAIELPAIFALWALWMLVARHRDWKRIIGDGLIVLATFVVTVAVAYGILRIFYPAMPAILKYAHLV